MLLLNWLALCLRVVVAAVFIGYALAKLRNLSSFAVTIRSHQLIPNSLSEFVAKTIVVLEVVLGLLFLFNVFPIISGIALAILLTLFSGILLRTRFAPQLNVKSCGCSGTNNRNDTIGKALFRNILLLCSIAGAIVITMMDRNSSFPLLLLIEVVALACIFVGVICSQTQLLFSILRAFGIEATQNGEETTVATHLGSRRSFIKRGIQLGVATLVGVGVLWEKISPALAYSGGRCPSGVSCACDPSGLSGEDCYKHFDCTGKEGEVVPVYETCDTYCCDRSSECASRTYQTDEYDCPIGCP